jgi:hypothetical protein
MISGRKSFAATEAWIFASAREHDMTVDPVLSNDERGKTHPHLKRDPCLLRQHVNGPIFSGDAQHLVEDRSHSRRLVLEMGGERMMATGVRLISVCKPAAAFWATPQRRTGHARLHGWANLVAQASCLWGRQASCLSKSTFARSRRDACCPHRQDACATSATIKTRIMPEAAPIIDVGREREEREVLAVHVVLEIEDPWETCPGNLGLVPRAIAPLRR